MNRWWRVSCVAMVMVAAVAGAACGDDGTRSTPKSTGTSTGDGSSGHVGPEPAAMCPSGQTPVVAAYGLQSGGFRWVACAPGNGLYVVRAASADTVVVQTWSSTDGSAAFLGYDTATGQQQWTGDESKYQAALADAVGVARQEAGVVDGIRLSGGQDDALTAVEDATGKQLWTREGRLVYDDVWAIGDGAVFAVELRDGGPVMVGYDIATGKVRWEDAIDRSAGYLSPWFVTGQRLLALWFNLQVRSTVDGSMSWQTTYAVPVSGYPRMMGAVANDDTVFVSFTGQVSGGD